ncbi:lytic murein transglycosylase B [Candidatus Nitrotoga sp. M5]|uniref:lytic murein transglycosylase B n=1 Tax=Candidatus Nitrotoga sp. M5 TaxID=2890409 RepID=UPI001EF7092A|nr:lytic murein transglycosylase B [Candidatus Nitrotoga sp. M5]CAH1387551.1 Membrane-bound lytic murein transglycosylase B [Candidatus Nitrotoga sp. M5]
MTISKLRSLLLLLCLIPLTAFANYEEREDVQQFITQMVTKHGFDRQKLHDMFSRAEKKDWVLKAIARPAEKTKTWAQYRSIFITDKRIDEGREFLRQHRETLARAEQKYSVPAEIITAIIGVETFYGQRSGSTLVLDSLTTLGFDYPPRSRFFLSELEQFLLLARDENIDASEILGSYAGAMGMPQFISSSYRHYAVDFDGDGKRDLWNNPADVIGSVANYFSTHGWSKGEPVTSRATVATPDSIDKINNLKPHTSIGELKLNGVTPLQSLEDDEMASVFRFDGESGDEYWLGLNNFYVITRYNHSSMYAMAVYQLSREILQKQLDK